MKGGLSARVGHAAKWGCRSERQRMTIEELETGPHQHHKILLLLLTTTTTTTTTVLMKKKRLVPITLDLALLLSRYACACQIETARRRHRHPTQQQHWRGQSNDEHGALAQARSTLQSRLPATMARHMRGHTPQPCGCRYEIRDEAPPQPPLRCPPKHLKGNHTTQHPLTTIATQGKNRG